MEWYKASLGRCRVDGHTRLIKSQCDLHFIRDNVLTLLTPSRIVSSYIDTNLAASDAQRLYYGSSYAKLQSIKKTYDPRNVFKLPSYQGVGLP